MSKEYKIETLSDIAAIPAESLDNFFVDLKSWLELRKGVEMANEAMGFEAIAVPQHIGWIDDGKNDIELNFSVKIEGGK